MDLEYATRMSAGNILQSDNNRVIECGNTLILGDNSDSNAPINIQGSGGRAITINGSEIQPASQSLVFYNFKDGFVDPDDPTNVLDLITVQTPAFQIGTFTNVPTPPITSAQVPRIARVRYGDRYQVFMSGTLYTPGGMPAGNYSLATLPNNPSFGPEFINWRPNQNLVFNNGGDPGANTGGLIIESATGVLQNTAGGSYASLDGISYWVDIPEP